MAEETINGETYTVTTLDSGHVIRELKMTEAQLAAMAPIIKNTMLQWDFIKKFSLEEWAAFKTLKKTDVTAEILDDFLMARPEIDLEDEYVRTGLAYLVTKGIITQAKADDILGA